MANGNLESVMVALLINKFGGAVANGIVGAIVIVSGMETAKGATDMTSEGLLILKIAMLIFPLICIVIGFIVYRSKYILDEKMYAKIVITQVYTISGIIILPR